MCCRRGEEGGQLGAPNCNLQLDFQTGPAPAGSWKSGKSVIKEGMEKQGMLVLHIRLATHPFEISTFPFLVSFLSQTFIILFLEITCMCVGMCRVPVPTEAMGSLAVRVRGRCKAPSVGAGDWAQVSIQRIRYTVFRAAHTLNGRVTAPALDFLLCNFQQRSNHFTEHFLFDGIWIETWFVWDCQMKCRTPVEI